MGIVLDKFKEDDIKIEKVISGGANGADTLAERWAKEQQYPFQAYYAEWDSFGRKAGPIRNSKMVKDADFVVAFPYETSTGTHDSITKTRSFPEKKLLVFKLS